MSTKKILSLGICVLLLFPFSLPALAADYTSVSASPAGVNYVYINEASSSLSISSGIATVKGYVQRTPLGTSIQLTSTLQRNSSGSWVAVKSWSKSSTSSSASISQTYSVSIGTYRVATFYSVSGSGGTESGTVYSTTVTY